MDIQKENVDFGDYCSIEQKRYGAPNELYGYKVVGRLRSNSWVDTPVDAQDRKPKLHSEIVDVVQVISCTAGCDVVEQFRVSDLTRAWQQAQKVAVPEGFVLVDQSKVKTFYQDDDEPENIVYSLNDLDVLGDCIDINDIISVTEASYAYTTKNQKYGVWKIQLIDSIGDIHRNFVLVDTREDAEFIVKSNKFIDAEWSKAQEQVG